MKKLTFLLLITIAVIISTSCTCTKCAEEREHELVPQTIVEKCNDMIIKKTGRKFFDKYISCDYQNSEKVKANYNMVYIYRDIDNDFVDEKIEFTVDSTASLVKGQNLNTVPDYKRNPENYHFTIDKSKAIDIAKENKLSEGMRNWEVSFRYEAAVNQYVWHILVTKTETKNDTRYKASGEEMFIDPVTGGVIKTREWKIQ